ncbi:hypothetical protein Rhal01_02394 [Rubritalea halochordaticola]|uniref:DUF1549 domain-containing protein n=1 Tax=Rubritalea halochordaticola TaxID=714537 RepID=A0ABP9V0L9_9BACT
MIVHYLRPFIGVFALISTVANAELSLEVVKNTARGIDERIQVNNAKQGIKPNPIVDDSTFVRRAYLNIIGRIPTYQETQEFIADSTPDKRHKLVDKLVYSPGFNSKMFNFYANMLRLQTNQGQFGLGWHVWLREQVNQNTPYDEIVYTMLASSGHASDNPAVGYYLRDTNMLLDNISNTAQVFLGTQIGCAQCHDHPFEDWTQKQYYQLAAFGATLEYNRSELAQKKVREVIEFKRGTAEPVARNDRKKRRNNMRQEAQGLRNVFRDFRRNEVNYISTKQLKLPHDYPYNDGKPGDVVSPAVLFGSMPKLDASSSGTEQLAAWVTSKDNPMFSKVIANRLWAHAIGYGLVEPQDNWTERSDISHPEVLDSLVKIMHLTDFDTRETLRIIYHTALFQRETCAFELEGGAAHDFRGPLLRRMSAEEIHDSLLTLEMGNIDDKENKALNYKWTAYTKGIHHLMEMSPKEVIELGESANEVEKKTRKLRTQITELRTKEAEFKAAGETEKSAKVRRDIAKLALQARQIRMDASSDKMVSMTMTRNLRTRARTPLRASEMPAPYNPGSFLRDFGASDREITNSQHTLSSIPQALSLLNGKESAMITDKRGKLADLLNKASKAEERLNILFLSIYSTLPNEKEKEQFLSLLDDPRDTRALAKAMLTSKRFIFVQ